MKYNLSDICDYVRGKVDVASLIYENYISTENMISNKGGITSASSLPSVAQTQSFQVGDILVSNIRPYFKKIWFAEFNGGCSNDVLVLRAKDGISKKFLYYVLTDDTFFNYSMLTSKGTKMPRGDKAAIMKYEVPGFTYKEQEKIAKILEAFDKKIQLNLNINDNLEQQATVLVNRYLSVITETVAFSEIIDFVNGFAFQSRTYLPAGQYRIITIKNVQDGKIDSTGASCIDCLPQRMKTNCILQIGDVLLSLTGNVGRVGIVCENNLLLNQRVAKFVPHRKELLPFLYFIFRHPSIKTQMESIAKGTAQLNLSPIETLNLSVPFEKTKALELSKVLSPIYQFIISNNQQNILLSSLRDELLPKLMSGEIDISDIKI